jgi:hypothetical protein
VPLDSGLQLSEFYSDMKSMNAVQVFLNIYPTRAGSMRNRMHATIPLQCRATARSAARRRDSLLCIHESQSYGHARMYPLLAKAVKKLDERFVWKNQ